MQMFTSILVTFCRNRKDKMITPLKGSRKSGLEEICTEKFRHLCAGGGASAEDTSGVGGLGGTPVHVGRPG